MKSVLDILTKIFLAVALLSGTAMADDTDIHFADGEVVSGSTVVNDSKDKLFVPESKNHDRVFDDAIKQLETGLVEFLLVKLVRTTANGSSSIEVEVSAIEVGERIALVGALNGMVYFIWEDSGPSRF